MRRVSRRVFLKGLAGAGLCALAGGALWADYRHSGAEQSTEAPSLPEHWREGMYYTGVAEEPSVYDAFKDNPMYLGGWYNETQNYDAGYAMGKALVDAGCTELVYVSGGRDYGVQMFIDRSNGFMDAIDEANAEGNTVTE